MKILVVGLGLIGGSVAKALKKNSSFTVLGYDISKETLAAALSSGAIDEIWDKNSMSDADLTILAVSPKLAVSFIKENAGLLKKSSVVTDVCGIKSWIVNELEPLCEKNGLMFIGGHPMAGKERGGFKNCDENLFNRAFYIITPTDNTNTQAIEIVTQYIKALNAAKITTTTPENHDRIIAFTSQIPHILAGAYVNSPSIEGRRGFSAGSFKDVSRVATVDENLWSELFSLNNEHLLPELDNLIDNLIKYRDAIKSGDNALLKETIKTGRIIKEKDIKEDR